jgi:hypothetical protein
MGVGEPDFQKISNMAFQSFRIFLINHANFQEKI